MIGQQNRIDLYKIIQNHTKSYKINNLSSSYASLKDSGMLRLQRSLKAAPEPRRERRRAASTGRPSQKPLVPEIHVFPTVGSPVSAMFLP